MKGILAVDPWLSGSRLGIYTGETARKMDETRLITVTLGPGEDPFAEYETLTGSTPDIVVIPGGSYRPSRPGSYWLNDALANDASYSDFWHPRNQMTIIAYRYCLEKKVPGVVLEPMNTAELLDEATFSGVEDYTRRGVFYALPQRIAWDLVCERLGKPTKDVSGVSVYLGDECCVSCHKSGRILDTSDPIMGEGPFGFRSVGTLPATAFLALIERGGLGERPHKKLKEESGAYSYAGREVDSPALLEETAMAGDPGALTGLSGMTYQVSKEIGRGVAALSGRVDAIALCGPGAALRSLTLGIKSRVSKWGKVMVFEEDLIIPALVKEGIEVLMGKSPKKYLPR